MKKILTFLLTLSMVISSSAIFVFANVAQVPCVIYTQDDMYEMQGDECQSGNGWKWDGPNKTLTLENAKDLAIYMDTFPDNFDKFVVLKGNNEVYQLWSRDEGTMYIKGDGTLQAKNGINAHQLVLQDDLTAIGGTTMEEQIPLTFENGEFTVNGISANYVYLSQGKQSAEKYTNIRVYLNGKSISFDQSPIIQDGRTLVPLRAIFEALGADVNWNGATKTIISVKDDTQITMKINEKKLVKNGESIVLDVPAQLVNGRTMVPARAVAEAFDCTVEWDGNTKTIQIMK